MTVHLPPELIAEFRAWASDCEWADSPDFATIDEQRLVSGVAANFAGGLMDAIATLSTDLEYDLIVDGDVIARHWTAEDVSLAWWNADETHVGVDLTSPDIHAEFVGHEVDPDCTCQTRRLLGV